MKKKKVNTTKKAKERWSGGTYDIIYIYIYKQQEMSNAHYQHGMDINPEENMWHAEWKDDLDDLNKVTEYNAEYNVSEINEHIWKRHEQFKQQTAVQHQAANDGERLQSRNVKHSVNCNVTPLFGQMMSKSDTDASKRDDMMLTMNRYGVTTDQSTNRFIGEHTLTEQRKEAKAESDEAKRIATESYKKTKHSSHEFTPHH